MNQEGVEATVPVEIEEEMRRKNGLVTERLVIVSDLLDFQADTSVYSCSAMHAWFQLLLALKKTAMG